jgi:hypothetical protein
MVGVRIAVGSVIVPTEWVFRDWEERLGHRGTPRAHSAVGGRFGSPHPKHVVTDVVNSQIEEALSDFLGVT